MTYLIIGHAKCNAGTVTPVTNRCLRKKEKTKFCRWFIVILTRPGWNESDTIYCLFPSSCVTWYTGKKWGKWSAVERNEREKKWTQIKCINWDSFVLRMECCLAIRFGQSTPKMDSSQQNFLFFLFKDENGVVVMRRDWPGLKEMDTFNSEFLLLSVRNVCLVCLIESKWISILLGSGGFDSISKQNCCCCCCSTARFQIEKGLDPIIGLNNSTVPKPTGFFCYYLFFEEKANRTSSSRRVHLSQ